jgi:hypothetical protein
MVMNPMENILRYYLRHRDSCWNEDEPNEVFPKENVSTLVQHTQNNSYVYSTTVVVHALTFACMTVAAQLGELWT